MAGLKRNFVELRDCVESFAEIPFLFLSVEKQALIIKNLTTIFSGILISLDKEDLEKTAFYTNVQGIISAIGDGFDEQKFALHLKLFIDALTQNDRSYAYEALSPVAKKFLDRITPFTASEAQARKYRDTHKIDEVRTHDTEIIKKPLQLYALDYFLFAYKNLSNSENKESSIISGIDKTPGLMADALDDDMLKKIVYSLYGKDIRKKMIQDYYTYKKVFLPVLNEQTLTREKISEIVEALRIYCLSLVDVSLEYEVASFQHSLLGSYQPGTDFLEIKKELSNA